VRGVEVGNIFKLGTRYSEAFGASFLNEDGRRKPVVMGSYGIGLGRLLACIAEEHHDENGFICPSPSRLTTSASSRPRRVRWPMGCTRG